MKKGQIYDCFMFFNELDVLELRLNILNDKVDYFVLAEATTTHSGERKELFFETNKARFGKFLPKIIHVVVDDMPKIINGDRWPSDTFQRNAVIRGLKKCKSDDIIMISDLDEIPNLDNLESIKNQLLTNSHKKDILYNIYNSFRKWLFNIKSQSKVLGYFKKASYFLPIKSKKMIMFKQKLYYYYLNGFMHDHWNGTRIVLYKDLIGQYNSTPQQIRNSLAKTVIENGGWHFSYLTTPENIAWKIKSITHSEFDKPEFTDVDLIKQRVEKGEYLYGKDFKITYVKMDNSYPKYILDNIKKYNSHIKS